MFCGGCRWYQQRECRHAHAVYEEKTPFGIVTMRYTAEERNALNDCPDYQPLDFWGLFRRYSGPHIMLLLLVWVLVWWLVGGGK